MHCLDFEATITVNGAALPEYQFEYDANAKTATCWIPSEAGKPFVIAFRCLVPQADTIGSYCFVDGTDIGGSICHANSVKTLTKRHVRTSPNTTRSLLFSATQLIEDESLANFSPTDELGNIVLKISRSRLLGHQGPSGRIRNVCTDPKIHEGSKKATVHQVGFGAERVSHKKNSWKATTLSTLITFTFKYRSLEVLRAHDIAPPPPPVIPAVPTTKGKRKAIDDVVVIVEDEQEHSLRLTDVLRRLQATNPVAKKEARSDSDSDFLKRPKRIPRIPSGHPPSKSLEVIDLTL